VFVKSRNASKGSVAFRNLPRSVLAAAEWENNDRVM
jgi:hypothetical protein